MNKIKLSIATGLLVLASWFVGGSTAPKLSGVSLDGAYQYRNIIPQSASSTAGVRIRGGQGVLGKITITRIATTTINIYDSLTSTSTDATLIATIYGTTTPSVPVTLDFDVAFSKGLVLDVPVTFAGDYTFSFK